MEAEAERLHREKKKGVSADTQEDTDYEKAIYCSMYYYNQIKDKQGDTKENVEKLAFYVKKVKELKDERSIK